MAYTLPTVAATTPRVRQGITIDRWALVRFVLMPDFPEANADPNGPHQPQVLAVEFNLGRLHPDGYFQGSPVPADTVQFQADDAVKAADSSNAVKNVLDALILNLGTVGKQKGLL